jgi:mono/diheme cytochrome c family protein
VRNLATFFILMLILISFAAAQSTGEVLYTQHCLACHGSELAGHTNFGKRATIPDLKTVVVQQRSDNDLFAAIGRGEGHKEYPHGFLSRGLTAAQVKNLITYIRSMSTVAPSKK